jgi:L-histidine N-alpha-methyltransferase
MVSRPSPVRAEVAESGFCADVWSGLASSPKAIPAKYFYDATGSALFDRICTLPEYYPTRTERAILDAHAGEMAATLGARVMLIEPGAGSSGKTRVLLRALDEPSAYVPVDISAEHLQHSAQALRAELPQIEVLPVAADFTEAFVIPRARQAPLRRAVFFPGSTLGNFEPAQARRLLAGFRPLAGRDGRLLLGVDLQKDVEVLERAYDDVEGVTAQFNLNLLARINRELDGNFNLSAFRHRAFYNREHGRIEMHLESRSGQVVRVAGRSFSFRANERLHTENSYKYTPESISALAASAGWRLIRQWRDPRDWFAMALFAPSL